MLSLALGVVAACGRIAYDDRALDAGVEDSGLIGDAYPADATGRTPPVTKTLTLANEHTCAISAGALYCWGDNSAGRLGIGDFDIARTTTPVRLGGASDWSHVSAFHRHTCAVRMDGSLWCWGRGGQGRLGLGTTSDHAAPQPVVSSIAWLVVSTGFGHTCAIASDGALWCWGANGYGEVGTGDPGVAHLVPQPVGAAASDWRAVSAGTNFNCGLRDGHAVWCWGSNMERQQADANTSLVVPAPRMLESIDSAVQIAAGSEHACVIRADRRLWCWGDNRAGQLGVGDSVRDSESAREVMPGSTWALVAAGGHETCGITTDGALWCWGENTRGQLGQGDVDVERHVPARVGTDEYAEVAVGGAHACARRLDDALFCWGRNELGQLGVGDTADRTTPVRVMGL